MLCGLSLTCKKAFDGVLNQESWKRCKYEMTWINLMEIQFGQTCIEMTLSNNKSA